MPSILDAAETISLPYPLRSFERSATSIAEKLTKCYESSEEAFRLPRRYGLTVRERKMAEASLQNKAFIQKDLASLVMKVAGKTGASIQDLATAIDSREGQLTFFTQHIDELQSIMSRSAMVDDDVVIVSSVIQSRINADWTTEDCLEMQEGLFNLFLDYIANERAGWPNEEDSDPKDSLEASSEPPKPKQKSQTGKGSGSKLVKGTKASTTS